MFDKSRWNLNCCILVFHSRKVVPNVRIQFIDLTLAISDYFIRICIYSFLLGPGESVFIDCRVIHKISIQRRYEFDLIFVLQYCLNCFLPCLSWASQGLVPDNPQFCLWWHLRPDFQLIIMIDNWWLYLLDKLQFLGDLHGLYHLLRKILSHSSLCSEMGSTHIFLEYVFLLVFQQFLVIFNVYNSTLWSFCRKTQRRNLSFSPYGLETAVIRWNCVNFAFLYVFKHI